MAIFDSTKKQYLTFYICLTNADAVKQYQAQYPTGVNRAIYNAGPPEGGASIEFAAPFRGYTQPAADQAPFTWTPWRDAGGTGKVFPIDVATFTRHTGGIFGVGGTTVRYYWMGEFQLAASQAASAAVPDEEANIPRRYWAEGFESSGLGIGSISSVNGFSYTRDASRHVGGLGLAIRGALATYTDAYLNFYDATATNVTSFWERLYIRLRKKPSVTRNFYRWSGLPTASVGLVLGISATGQLAVSRADSGGTIAPISTIDAGFQEWDGSASQNAWHRVDILHTAGKTASTNEHRIYVDAVLKGTFSSDTSGVGARCNYTRIGGLDTTGPTDLEIDIDDWHAADIPRRTIGGVATEKLNSKDWVNGTKIVLVHPSGAASGDGTWAGDKRALLQSPVINTVVPFELSSSTPSDVLAVTVDDATPLVKADPGSIGVAAVCVMGDAKRHTLGATDAMLGYRIAAGADVYTAVTVGTTLGRVVTIFSNHTTKGEGGGAPTLAEATPIVLLYKKDTSVQAASIAALMAQVEMIGKWGPEDYTAAELQGLTVEPAAGSGHHNGPYPATPWARRGAAAPISPFFVKGGTYVGNDTGQDLLFRAPVHMLWIRKVAAGVGPGSFWCSTMATNPHRDCSEGSIASIPLIEQDPTFVAPAGEDVQSMQFRVRIQGNEPKFNANGVTYQYIAVMDPGMRYMLNHVVTHKSTAGDEINKLVAGAFAPDWMFIFGESTTSTVTKRLAAKGPGYVGTTTIARFGTTALASAIDESTAGQVTTKAALHSWSTSVEGWNLCLWRRHDGLNDTGEARVVNIGSYVGDGVASRTITLAPAANRRPMWAFVIGDNGSGCTRDPSHTGTTSTNADGSDTAIGITAGGIDSFTVGATLNAANAVYHYFILFGIDACTSSGGWGCNGETGPVEPNSPPGGPGTPWPADPTEPTGPGQPAPPGPAPTPNPWPGGSPDLPPDFSVACAPWTTYMVNVALSRIGVSKQIAAIATDGSEEAYKARLCYAMDVEQVLRDFPWPFATKFAALALVTGAVGAPANADWTYAYRRPTDCVFERRLVRARGDALDPTPPPFALGRDANGPLIFTNQATATLEYTYRVECAATAGDYLFREALVWRHAASLAGPLARSAEVVTMCLEAYRRAIAHAEDVIRPGIPGVPAALVDPEAALKARLVNRALIRIGCRTIVDYLTDQSREAVAARSVFSDDFEAVLRDFPWPFATKYASLALVLGTPASPANLDWIYAYRIPTDALAARRLVKQGVGRAWDPAPLRFRLGTDATGGLLFTDEQTAVLEYTVRSTLAASDVLFRDALAWRLAASLAPSVAPVDPDVPEQLGRGPDPNALTTPSWRQPRPDARLQARQAIADRAMQMYLLTLQKAKATVASEQQQPPDGDASWITGRN